MNNTAGAPNLALWKTWVNDFSESPTYGENMDADEMLKNVAPDIEAIALANVVLPQPGGPYISTPFVLLTSNFLNFSG